MISAPSHARGARTTLGEATPKWACLRSRGGAMVRVRLGTDKKSKANQLLHAPARTESDAPVQLGRLARATRGLSLALLTGSSKEKESRREFTAHLSPTDNTNLAPNQSDWGWSSPSEDSP